jgi:3-methylcrotonyl-CoA carboxylase alpha subunit
MAAAAIPVLPGYRGADQDDDALAAEAGRLGLPLIVKPSAGGGGKGMRVVRQQGELLAALAGARREAAGAFGDAHLVLERYLEHPRHVEVQVFCDAHGGAVHLLERDCSVQRRHQKVLEEAPAPGLPGSLRARMGEVAVRAARAIGYVGAGTVEFLLDAAGGTTVTDDTSFYFMEMNTRLQVEHPVTEMILGLDLVEWQLRVAAGEPLPCTQTDIAPSGHAIEARIYAEDPGNDFLPSTGRIRALHEPDARPWLRIDSGVKAGDLIGVHYDPMLAKLVVHGADRRHAVEHLRQALAGYDLVGPATNVGFLERVAVHPAFTAGSVDTGFIARHAEELLAGEPAEERALILAAVLAMLQENTGAGGEPAGAPGTPWVRLEDWRLNASPWREIVLTTEAGDVPVRVAREADAFAVTLGEERHLVRARPGPHGRLGAEMHGQRVTLRWLRDGSTLRLHGAGLRCVVGVRDSDHRTRLAQAEGGHLTAPMPGKVVRVLVTQGERVRAGQALVVIEAMKMEHTVASATAGTVVRIDYEEGDQVEEGVELVVVEAPAASE